MRLFQGDELQSPCGIAVNTTGKIAMTDVQDHCVYIFDKEGNCLRNLGSRGRHAGQYEQPWRVKFLNDNEILIADQGNHRIQQVNVQTTNGARKKDTTMETNRPVQFEKRFFIILFFSIFRAC